MKTCAICTNLTASGSMQSLDPAGPLYYVCTRCSSEIPTATYGTRGYTPSGGLLRADDLTAAMRRVMGDERYEAETQRAVEEGRAPGPARSTDDVEYEAFVAEGHRRKRTRADQKAGTPVSISAGSERRRKW